MSQEPVAAPKPAAPSIPPSGPATLSPLVPASGASPDTAAEAPLWAGRTHWSHFIGSVALTVLLVLLIGFVCYKLSAWGKVGGTAAFRAGAVLILACLILSSVRILWKVLSSRYRLTTQRLFIERGVLSQTIDQMELIRLDDVRVRRTLIDRALGLGTVEVVSTDATDKAVMMEGVRDPNVVVEHLRERMRQLRRKSVFVENL